MQLMGQVLQEEEEDASMWPEFTIHHDGSGRLTIMKESALKAVSVLMMDFSPMPNDHVKQSIAYRYSKLIQDLAL